MYDVCCSGEILKIDQTSMNAEKFDILGPKGPSVKLRCFLNRQTLALVKSSCRFKEFFQKVQSTLSTSSERRKRTEKNTNSKRQDLCRFIR
jgi:hypothetical protein